MKYCCIAPPLCRGVSLWKTLLTAPKLQWFHLCFAVAQTNADKKKTFIFAELSDLVWLQPYSFLTRLFISAFTIRQWIKSPLISWEMDRWTKIVNLPKFQIYMWSGAIIDSHPIKWVLYYAIHSVKRLKPSASVNWTHFSFQKQFRVCSKWYFSKSVSKQLSYLIRWLQWLSHGAVGFLVTGVWQILKQIKLKLATTSIQMGCVSVSDFVQTWPAANKPTDSNICLKNTGRYSSSHWITAFGNIWLVVRIRIRPHISTFIRTYVLF